MSSFFVNFLCLNVIVNKISLFLKSFYFCSTLQYFIMFVHFSQSMFFEITIIKSFQSKVDASRPEMYLIFILQMFKEVMGRS